MDDFGDQVQGARTFVVEGQAAGGRRKGRAKSRDPSQAREEMGDVEARLAKVELHLINGDERFKELGYRLLELVEVMEETREEMQATLNETIDKLAKIERRGAQNLAIAIAITESFVEFKKMDRSKGRDGRDSKGKNWGDKCGSKEGGNKEGLREGNAKRERFKKEDSKDGKFKNFDKFSKPGERPPMKCLLCDGPYRARECPKNAALIALAGEREEGSSH
ncbi:hypothetical protein GH714_007932 [Hevea brasiliensis]|uniref:Uncharacterized protein n=1 Tax=Hevea brasiliensis TaxID=3981 RepID=A0A6A6NA27_HEVBR|nr:hypothetical protein GH714_007932 [Hevea brasiliensis]